MQANSSIPKSDVLPDWLAGPLNLRGLDLRDPAIRLDWMIELAPWQWALLAMACVIGAVWCYRRVEGNLAVRCVLGGLRAAILLALIAMLCGPRLTRSSESVERDWAAVLIDRSASMTIADGPVENQSDGAAAQAQLQTREAQLRRALQLGKTSFDTIATQRSLVWLGFDAGAFELRAPVAGQGASDLPVVLGEPIGRRTNLAEAITQALARTAARPVSGIVVLTDGRASDALPRSLLRRLEAEKIAIFPLPLGSAEPVADFSVRLVQGPGAAFVNDAVPVEITVERTGPLADAAATGDSTATVELYDKDTGRVLAQQQVDFGSPAGRPPALDAASVAKSTTVTRTLPLIATPSKAGVANWAVRILPGNGKADFVAGNDQLPLTLALTDRPLRVLYIDGYPRWEYRYLKNLLAREKSTRFTALLLAPGRRYIQEGNEDLESAPTRPEDWDRYDVLIMGDVRPDVFSNDQLAAIRRRVAVGGAGLLWIGGASATPDAWRSTPLADLLPFTTTDRAAASALSSSAARAGTRIWEQDVTASPTPLATRLGVLKLADTPLSTVDQARVNQLPGVDGAELPIFWPPEVSDPATGWSRLRWVQRIELRQLKPAAEVLALATPVSGDGAAASALVSTMRFGAGRAIYVATDEIWRYRYGRGEELPERFWLQLVRLLGRDALARSNAAAVLEVTPGRAAVATPLRISLQLLDQQLAGAAPASVPVRLVGDAPGLPPIEVVLRRESGGDQATSVDGAASQPQVQRDDAAISYSAIWVPQTPGRYTASPTGPLFSALNATDANARPITAQADIFLPDDELRNPETDHALLAELARISGGKVLSMSDLPKLQEILPRREIRTTSIAEARTLWDSPAALALLILLCAAEWVGRRLIRLF